MSGRWVGKNFNNGRLALSSFNGKLTPRGDPTQVTLIINQLTNKMQGRDNI